MNGHRLFLVASDSLRVCGEFCGPVTDQNLFTTKAIKDNFRQSIDFCTNANALVNEYDEPFFVDGKDC